MSKKEFLILIIVFLSVIVIATLSMYFIFNKTTDESSKINNVLKVGDYTLRYGHYKGIEKQYTADTQTLEKKEIILNK